MSRIFKRADAFLQVWTNSNNEKNNDRDIIRGSSNSELASLSHVICPPVPVESVNGRTFKAWTAGREFCVRILERVRARGWLRGNDAKRDRREEKKESARRCVPPRYLSPASAHSSPGSNRGGGYKVLVCGDIGSLPCPGAESRARDLHPLG